MNDEKTTELDLSQVDDNKIIHVNFRPERARGHAPLRTPPSQPIAMAPRKPTTHVVLAMVRELDLKKSWYARLLAVLVILFLSLLVL